MNSENDEFKEWLIYGIEKNWCSEPWCDVHDPMFLMDNNDKCFVTVEIKREVPYFHLIRQAD
tara:strand:+ start:137 stop:322 length:186 start_codon:yes stop_codon:yes gene_type:complete